MSIEYATITLTIKYSKDSKVTHKQTNWEPESGFNRYEVLEIEAEDEDDIPAEISDQIINAVKEYEGLEFYENF